MVIKNTKGIELPKIDELEEKANSVPQAVKGAALAEKTKGKGGRKKKTEDEKAVRHVSINLTKEQHEELLRKAKGVSLSSLIKTVLVEKGLL